MDSIWMLLEQCWDWEPLYRPNSTYVLAAILQIYRSGGAGVATPEEFKPKMKDIDIDLAMERKINPYTTAIELDGTVTHYPLTYVFNFPLRSPSWSLHSAHRAVPAR